MQILQNLSLRRKQTLIIMLASSLVLLLACTAVVVYVVRNFRSNLIENTDTLTDVIAKHSTAAIDFNDAKAADESLAALRAQAHIIAACIYDRTGRVFALYQRDRAAAAFAFPPTGGDGHEFKNGQLRVFYPIRDNGETIGTIFIASDLKQMSQALTRFAGIIGGVFGISLLLALGLSNWLQRFISDPILHLVQVSRMVAHGKNYSARATKQNDDEVGRLIDEFNEMLAQIQARDIALRQANHALQTEVVEHQRAEESLRLLSSAVEQAKESIVITDMELDLPGPKIIFVNPAFTQMTGYTAGEVLGKTPRILQGPKSDRAVLRRLRETLGRGETFAGETVNYRKDGTEFNLEWQIAPLSNAGGKITHFVAIQHDITARKQLEAQLFQSQKMETVGKLAGGIAHEFNSILTAIIGQSDLLLEDLPPGSPLAANVTEISMAAGRAAGLTRQLLAYGRKQFLQPESLDLNHVVTGMEGVFRNLLGGVVALRLVPAPGLHLVKADAGQIEQVIMNMVINAREAMPNGGKLTLETANVKLEREYVDRFPEFEVNAGDYVMLAISDTGPGMSEGVKARVFEPFFSTKGVGEGTGLGLSTCYGIVKQSGGHISVYSEQGRGTTFKIYLPQVAAQAPLPVQRLDSPNLPRGTETILLVGDDSALREMAAALLRRLGYTVMAAANAIEALSLSQPPITGPIDLLFTDVVMPHMSGKELADRLREFNPQMKILFTSAYTENDVIHQGGLAEGAALLQKPFTPSALVHKLRKVLDQPPPAKPDPA